MAYIGESDNARSFIESCDEASEAALKCSAPVAAKLAAFHASGQLAKLSRPRELLSVIAENGRDDADAIALFAVQHGKELEDEAAFAAFIEAPLDFALGLKTLSQGAAEVKARRDTAAPSGPSVGITDWRSFAIVVGIVAVIALLLWKIRQRRRAAALAPDRPREEKSMFAEMPLAPVWLVLFVVFAIGCIGLGRHLYLIVRRTQAWARMSRKWRERITAWLQQRQEKRMQKETDRREGNRRPFGAAGGLLRLFLDRN